MTTNHQSLAGKVALVTGGSRGIGAAIVQRLAQEGAIVAFTYSTSTQKAEAIAQSVVDKGGQSLAIQADSAHVDAVQNAVETTVEQFGQLDILVNNAGILTTGTVDDYSLEDFDRMIAVNVRAIFVAAKAASPHLKEGGRIITIGSIVGDRAAIPGASAYSTTKAAVAGLVRGLARDFGTRGITVNNVQPGPTITDMTPADLPGIETLKEISALKRVGQDSEIASFVAYLASPEAGYITGASLNIDGGFTS